MNNDKQSFPSILKDKKFLSGLLLGLISVAAVAVLAWFSLAIVNNYRQPSNRISNLDNSAGPETEPITNLEINTFELKKDAQICREDGRPVVYLFTASSCPHCEWIGETFNQTVSVWQKNGQIKAYNFDVETGDDLLTEEIETELPASAISVLNEFEPQGYIPVFVFGCKYFRVGNGYEQEGSLANEIKEFTAVIKEIIK